MGTFTYETKIKELMQNPLANDTLHRFFDSKKVPADILEKHPLSELTLGALQKISLPFVKKEFFDTCLDLFNGYTEQPVADEYVEPQEIWWKESVIYQIYPRSFCDSDGDGIGDIAGIRSKIPYLKDLGVDTIWLSPIYDSPNDDNGYDIRNYQQIMEEFGTMQDFDDMLREIHAHDMRLVMDLVINHTSDEHPWFQGALAGDEKYKDYYIFCEHKPNWESFFGGSAFTYYDELEKYALHLFTKKQMDLNWKNPELRQELYDMVGWWLDKGVDGFRMDVINLIAKKDGLPDGDAMMAHLGGQMGVEHYISNAKLHEYLNEMHTEAFDRYGDKVMIGETPGVGYEQIKLMTARERKELDMVFSFDHLYNPGSVRFTEKPYDLTHLRNYHTRWQAMPNNCWNSLFYDNHDNPRMLQRVAPKPQYRDNVAKLLAVILLTLKGTPFIYQGQEIGMAEGEFESLEDYRDVESFNMYNIWKDTIGVEKAMKRLWHGSRDHARTPMQWTNGEHAGFTTGTPWIASPKDVGSYCVEQQQLLKDGVLATYKQLIALRKKEKCLVYGEFKPVFAMDNDRFCYFRMYKGEKFFVECNITDGRIQRRGEIMNMENVYASYGDYTSVLRPYEANIYKVLG